MTVAWPLEYHRGRSTEREADSIASDQLPQFTPIRVTRQITYSINGRAFIIRGYEYEQKETEDIII